jgi:adenosylmethionine-8-amino-7-oxononanoate aminotransferase
VEPPGPHVADAKVFFGSGGSDGIDTAAKLARRYWQLAGQTNKRIIISRDGGYHGLHGFGTSLAGIPFNREGYGSESLIPETARVPTNDADALEATVRHLGPDRVAAVFAEPVIGTGGVIYPAPDYLQRVEAICREHDVLLVIDEVITGFGRTGQMFATETYGLMPDMLIMAKGISSPSSTGRWRPWPITGWWRRSGPVTPCWPGSSSDPMFPASRSSGAASRPASCSG